MHMTRLNKNRHGWHLPIILALGRWRQQQIDVSSRTAQATYKAMFQKKQNHVLSSIVGG